MVPTVMALKARIATGADPTTPSFWFVMSMGLLVDFIVAYPMNWWLVANHLKHGMMTIRPARAAAGAHDHGSSAGEDDAPPTTRRMSMDSEEAPWPPVLEMALLSFLALAAGVAIGFLPAARERDLATNGRFGLDTPPNRPCRPRRAPPARSPRGGCVGGPARSGERYQAAAGGRPPAFPSGDLPEPRDGAGSAAE